ncbi:MULTISPECIES: TetR/AcrR family transcriptional regulator [Silvimonas]|uniref:TetR/AcrR family transcriptional regulator n=1 Tax=Silvimonas TaxID=300264 RepID=UPI0024B3B09D|nr:MULTISPECIES: TetR/AcrR family transcriptional regulator [Silvimonas]MDR3427538.1 helix-turn-helix domain containing protein [Silvimonas sp.]
MSILAKLSFKDQAFKLREDAILDATTRTLASKGFDLMTMDDIAAEVGISKPSLYKHFKSKDDLVGEAMIRLLDAALVWFAALPPDLTPAEKLRGLLAWALQIRLEGGLPLMPSTSPQVRDMLTRNMRYVTRVLKLNGVLEKTVQKAKAKGELRSNLPDQVILFSYYSRTCDPAVDYLRLYAKMDDDKIIAHMIDVFFEGVSQSS